MRQPRSRFWQPTIAASSFVYYQAKDPTNLGRFKVYRRDNDAYWLDQLKLDD